MKVRNSITSQQNAVNTKLPQQSVKSLNQDKGSDSIPQPIMKQRQDAVSDVKKKSTGKLLLIFLLIIIAVLVVYVVINKLNSTKKVNTVKYEYSGKYTLDILQSAVKNYNKDTLNSLCDNSWLAQEWAYANSDKKQEDWINMVCSYVSFNYPVVDADDSTFCVKTDNGYINAMLNNEKFSVTVPDYSAIAELILSDKDNILKVYKSTGYSDKDYNYTSEMEDLLLEYLLSQPSLPTCEVEINIPLINAGSKDCKIEDDSNLDNILFGSDSYREMFDAYGKVITGWTGKKTEYYTEKEEQSNPEYTSWKAKLDEYMAQDGGVFKKGISKWEPWYLRDSSNNYILDENGKWKVNYYTIKDENGNDVKQPDEKIMVEVQKEREVDDPFVGEKVITYTWCGAYYAQNIYKGKSVKEYQVGDGTFEHPAGTGTAIITKVLGSDKKFHDVKVTLVGYWTGKDASSYVVKFSEKNRGFDSTSVVQLICYEVLVENLESSPITISSEMFLSDSNANQSNRTGSMYGFTDSVTIDGNSYRVINDWSTSTELDQKYVCWGKDFNREYNVVWFKVLAGSGGEVKQFNANESSINKGDVSSNESSTSISQTDTTIVE